MHHAGEYEPKAAFFLPGDGRRSDKRDVMGARCAFYPEIAKIQWVCAYNEVYSRQEDSR